MAEPERYDALVLGSGQGGQLMAWHLARSGQRAAVVERRYVAGSCPMIACMPSKNEIWGARVAHLTQHGAHYGVTAGPVAIDMARVRERKRAMVNEEEAFHRGLFKESGAELIEGSGRFVAPKTLEVSLNAGGARVLAGERIFLNLGTHAAIPDIPGLADARPLTHIELLELDRVPAHLIVLGGGYVGIEFAQAYRRFGSHVTVIEPGQHLMSREDPDVVDEMNRLLTDEGIDLLTSADLLSVQGRSGEQVSLTVRTENGDKAVTASDILVSTGRVPNTAGIGLDITGVELDARGYIRVNDRLETTAPDTWAIGECAGSPHFTHISVDDFRIIHTNLAGGSRSTHDRLVPYCLFTDPPLAHVGLHASEAKQQGVAVRIAKLPMGGVLRAHTTDERRGFAKMLIGDDDRILGFTMIGAEAGEVATVVQTAMVANLPYQALGSMPIAHLTMAEGLNFLLLNVPAK
jgi:pyruvate/2-oxoglutarate dehydrogenase complex dihydrolipoamide dehydrogenase (E3) component